MFNLTSLLKHLLSLCHLVQLVLTRDSFTTAFVKNLIVVLVWFVLTYINSTLVATFFRHQVHKESHSCSNMINKCLVSSVACPWSVKNKMFQICLFDGKKMRS